MDCSIEPWFGVRPVVRSLGIWAFGGADMVKADGDVSLIAITTPRVSLVVLGNPSISISESFGGLVEYRKMFLGGESFCNEPIPGRYYKILSTPNSHQLNTTIRSPNVADSARL